MSTEHDGQLPATVDTPSYHIGHAKDVAGQCKQIVEATAIKIQGRGHVRVEGWQAIAIAHGCVASARDVEMIPGSAESVGGVRAIGEVRRMDNGQVIATAEGFVGNDEPMWKKRNEFARRAMAQTRAISRVCRSAFAHVVILMNAGLSTTPAEEMDGDDERSHHAPPQQAPKTVTAEVEPPLNRGQRLNKLSDKLAEITKGMPLRGTTLLKHVADTSSFSQLTDERLATLEAMSTAEWEQAARQALEAAGV